MFKEKINFDSFVRGLILVAIVVLIGWVIDYLSFVLLPFFVAWLAAYLLNPIVTFFQVQCRLRLRSLCIFLTIGLICGVLYLIGSLVIPPMVEEIAHLKDVALRFLDQDEGYGSVPFMLSDFLREDSIHDIILKLLSEQDLASLIREIAPQAWNTLWSAAGLLMNVLASLMGVLYLFFLLWDYDRLNQALVDLTPPHRRSFVRGLLSDTERYMQSYFRGQALVALSNCVMFSVGFLILDFPVAVGLGCFIGAISFVPYVQVAGILPAAILALLRTADTGENFWWLMGGVVLVYIVVQVLQDTVFTPRIMGHLMGLPPVVVLLALSVGGCAFGLIGLVIALPTTTLILLYYKRFVLQQDEGKDAGTPPEPPVKSDALTAEPSAPPPPEA